MATNRILNDLGFCTVFKDGAYGLSGDHHVARPEMFAVRWRSGRSQGWSSLYPASWFENEGHWLRREHRTNGPKGGSYASWCSVEVCEGHADLSYGGDHEKHNEGHLFIGTVRLVFADDQRMAVEEVWWQSDEPGAEFVLEDVDIFPLADRSDDLATFDPTNIEDGRRKIERLVTLRQGQRAFRQALLSAYQGRCAISGCDVEEVLEAAHIMPYMGEHTNAVTNGLLLRADLHTLFDLGLIMIDADYRISASEKIGGAFSLPSHITNLPTSLALRPSSAALEEKLKLYPER
ncbi:HNH endonuclease [Novosphingobium sp. BL-52-GroH]|uniref:HNH endonuclease n=1 Tax=Novosphingobium sp. BL-52-GroH TaxID=3349877 RepID=UPI00384F0702